MNGEGQLEPSFGWRATHVMSLRGFQLFHLRSKRRRRLLLLPLFSLTFYTVTSFDRGWGREGERGRKKRKRKRLLVSAGESVQAPAVQSSLSSGDKATCFFFFCVRVSAPTFFSLCFGCFCNKSAYPSARYISFLSGCVTCTRQKGRFGMTAGFWLQQASWLIAAIFLLTKLL